jgi:hypothetical protein
MVMPGMHDMHVHSLGTIEPDMCDLESVSRSLEELVPVLRGCIEEFDVAPGDWLIVLQWPFSSGNQPGEDLPNIRAALDAVSNEHPIFLWGDDGHHGAANSAAFATARNEAGDVIGIDAATLRSDFDEFRPMIAVDAAGEPTGEIAEDARKLLRSDPFADLSAWAAILQTKCHGSQPGWRKVVSLLCKMRS